LKCNDISKFILHCLTIPRRNVQEKSQVEYYSDTMNIGDSFAGVKQPEL